MDEDVEIKLKLDQLTSRYVLSITFMKNIEYKPNLIERFFEKIDTIISKKINGKSFCVMVDFQLVGMVDLRVGTNYISEIADIGRKYIQNMHRCAVFVNSETIVAIIKEGQRIRPPSVPTETFSNLKDAWNFIRTENESNGRS
jgi:hypothetical protein